MKIQIGKLKIIINKIKDVNVSIENYILNNAKDEIKNNTVNAIIKADSKEYRSQVIATHNANAIIDEMLKDELFRESIKDFLANPENRHATVRI